MVPGWIKYARLKHRPAHPLSPFKLRQNPFKLIASAGTTPICGHALEIETSAVSLRIHRLITRKCIFVVPEQRSTIPLSYLPQALGEDRESDIVNAAQLFG